MNEKAFFIDLIKASEVEKIKKLTRLRKPIPVDFESLSKEIDVNNTIESLIESLVLHFEEHGIESIKLINFEKLDGAQQAFFITQLEKIAYPTFCEGYENFCKTPEIKENIQTLVNRNLFLSFYPKPPVTGNQPIDLWQCVVDYLMPGVHETVSDAAEINFFRIHNRPSNFERVRKINSALRSISQRVFPEYIRQLAERLKQNPSYASFRYTPSSLSVNKESALGKKELQSLTQHSKQLRCFKEFHLEIQLSTEYDKNEVTIQRIFKKS